MSVKLRQRESGNKIVLYLDIYAKGKRKTVYLKELYLVPKPEKGRLNKEQNDHNKETMEIAEEARYQKEIELRNNNYSIKDYSKSQVSFLAFFEKLMNRKNESIGNYGNWLSTKLHLEAYSSPLLTLADIDKDWLLGFRDYLQNTARTKGKKNLSVNTQVSYFSKIKAALKEAFKEELISKNIGEMVEHIKNEETERNFLSMEELLAVSKEECEFPALKNAFLFSCLTGLRWSDIEKLTWSEIQYTASGGFTIRFRTKKTGSIENHFIPAQAYELLGDRKKPTDKVFDGLKYSAWNNLKLQQWIFKAGVYKTITFHCARHTYATLQISLGTDVYTLQSLLGHKSIKNTQIYAKIMDDRKQEAANRLNIKL